MSIAHFLIVGTNYHPDPNRKLGVAEEDARRIEKVFKSFNESYAIKSLIKDNATKDAIEKEIDKLSQLQSSSNLLFVYWAGHLERKKDDTWLITENISNFDDAQSKNLDFVLENHLLSAKGFARRISDLKNFTHKVLVFDTCYSEEITNIFNVDTNSLAISILAASRKNSEAKEDNNSGYLTGRLLKELENTRKKPILDVDLSVVFKKVAKKVKDDTGQNCVLADKYTGGSKISLPMQPRNIDRANAKSPLEEAIYYATQAFRNYLNREVIGNVELIYFLGYDVWDGSLVYDGLVHGSIEERLLSFIRHRFLDQDRLRSKYEEYIAEKEFDKLGVAGECLYKSQNKLKEIFEGLNNISDITSKSNSYSFDNPTLTGIQYVGDLNAYESEYRYYDQLLGLRSCLYIPVIDNILSPDFWLGSNEDLEKNIKSELDARDYGRIPRGGVLIAANRRAYGLVPKNEEVYKIYSNIPQEISDLFSLSESNEDLDNTIRKQPEIFSLSQYEKIITTDLEKKFKSDLKAFDINITEQLCNQIKGTTLEPKSENKKFFPPINDKELTSFIRCIGAVYKQKSDSKIKLRQGIHPVLLKKAISTVKKRRNNTNKYLDQSIIRNTIKLIGENTEKKRITYNSASEFKDNLFEKVDILLRQFVPVIEDESLSKKIDETKIKEITTIYTLALLWRDLHVELRIQESNIDRNSEAISEIISKLSEPIPSFLSESLDIPATEEIDLQSIKIYDYIDLVSEKSDKNASIELKLINITNNLIDNIRDASDSPFNIAYSVLKTLAPIEPYITSVSELEGTFGSSVKDELFYDLSHSILIWILGIWALNTSWEEKKGLKAKAIKNIDNFFKTKSKLFTKINEENQVENFQVSIHPWQSNEDSNYLIIYWGLIAAMHDIAIPVQRFRQLCLDFFKKYFGNDTLPKNPEINILEHPRFPLYKSAITSLYKRRQRDWLEIIFYYALKEHNEHSVIGSLLFLLELEPLCPYRDDPSIWHYIKPYLKNISLNNKEQQELGLLIPAYLAHSIAFSDFPTLKDQWDKKNEEWQTDNHLEYFGKVDENFHISFENYPLTYLLALFETIIEPNNSSQLLSGFISLNKENKIKEKFFNIHYGSFYIKDLEQNDCNMIISVSFWLNNLVQEGEKIDVKIISNLLRIYDSYARSSKESKINNNWILCPSREFKIIKEYYENQTNVTFQDLGEYFSINFVNKDELKFRKEIFEEEVFEEEKDRKVLFTVPKYKNMGTEYYLSPKVYACLRLLCDLRLFYKTFVSKQLKFSVEFCNIVNEAQKNLVYSSECNPPPELFSNQSDSD